MSGTLAIPASAIVSVTPSVISAGGNALDLSGLFLTLNTRVPIGMVLSFPSAAAVGIFFGGASTEAMLAGNYFLGFDNSNAKPGSMLFAQYPIVPVGAYLRGATLGLTLSQLQGLTPGVITVPLDGTPHTSSTINFSSATSFSSAAEIASLALAVTGPQTAAFTGAIAGTVLTVSIIGSGGLAVGQEVRGAGIAAGTQIVSFGSGVGSTGTYNLSGSPQTVSSEAMTSNTPTVTYDSVTGAFVITSTTTGNASTIDFATGAMAAPLKLTLTTGAALSQGTVGTTPAAFMAALIDISQDWAGFTTIFDPDNGSGNTQKLAFAAWVNTTVDRYFYVAWDTDASPTVSGNATASLGNILQTANSNGTIPIYSPTQGPVQAAFNLGAIASIDFTETNGRTTIAFRSQTGITPDVTSRTAAANLEANGYNYYGRWSTANDRFVWEYPGQITGPFEWIDSYINQIWLNNQFQLDFMVLLQNAKSIPYNAQGYGLIRAAMLDTVNQALNFGAFRPGITLSQAQIAEVNNSAGKKIDDTLSTQGWYIQITDALPQVRAVRGSPPITIWYMDGQSVQKIALASVEVQ